jgi:hypothetical protein
MVTTIQKLNTAWLACLRFLSESKMLHLGGTPDNYWLVIFRVLSKVLLEFRPRHRRKLFLGRLVPEQRLVMK